MLKHHSSQAPSHFAFSLSEKCRNLGPVSLSHWILKSLFCKSFGQTNLFKCLKNALLKMSINFRMDFVEVLSSSLGAHVIELNICHTITDFARLAKDIKKCLLALPVHRKSEKIIIHSAGEIKSDHTITGALSENGTNSRFGASLHYLWTDSWSWMVY